MIKYWRGCDEDCFNCRYKDCLKPDNQLKSLDPRGRREKRDKTREDDRRMREAIDEALDELRLR